MPRFEKGSQEAKDYMASLRAKRGMKTGAGPLEDLASIGNAMGKPFKETIGVNPFTLGYDLGKNVIAPAIKKGRGKGSSSSSDTIIDLQNRLNVAMERLRQIAPETVEVGETASVLNSLRNASMSPQEIREVSKVVAEIRIKK